MAWDPREQAQKRSDALAQLESARTQALATIAAGRADGATSDQIKAADGAAAALATTRAEKTATAAAAFADVWAKSFEGNPRAAPSGLRLSVVQAGNPAATDLMLLESPEPIAWDRVSASIVPAAAVPLAHTTITLGTDFGRPDMGFEVSYGGSSGARESSCGSTTARSAHGLTSRSMSRWYCRARPVRMSSSARRIARTSM